MTRLMGRWAAHGRELSRAVLSRGASRPVLLVFLLALAVRVATAVVTNVFHEGVLIPDEATYLRIADLKSTGDLSVEPTLRCLEYANAEDYGTPLWCPYWRNLFESTRTFSWPLTGLFWIFGPHLILGQLLAGLSGALAAAATAWLAMSFLRKPFALGAGLVVALLPSQVLYSSVALRESTIWLCLACLGGLLGLSACQTDRRRVTLSAVGLALLFVLLAWLRIQTAVVALFCAVPVFALVGKHRRFRVLCATGVLLITPVFVGVGVGAMDFLNSSLGQLEYSRHVMSIGADTAFSHTAWTEVPAARSSNDRQVGAMAIIDREDEVGRTWDLIVVLPSGIHDTLIRPVFWDSSDVRDISFRHRLATLESPFWILGFFLAFVGVYMFRRRFSAVAFPFLLLLGIGVSGAVSHGNLGTAFRHREQMVFALAVLAVAGIEAVVDWRRLTRSQDAEEASPATYQ